MRNDGINCCSGVCTNCYKADFTDISMSYVSAELVNIICENGKRLEVTMHNRLVSVNALCGVIELTVSIHALWTILKQCMPKNIGYIFVLMGPNERHDLTVAMRKCILLDDSAIGASHITLGCPSTKVIVITADCCHFEFPPSCYL